MLTNISLEEAIQLIREESKLLGIERRLLLDALGYTLAEDIFAGIDQPPFDRSPLDGYALRAEDSIGATPEKPVELKVVDKVYAGDVANIPVGEKEAVRIMTGAMLPPGCDCVIRQEDTDMGEDRVLLYQGLKPGDNYVYRGEDYSKGKRLLSAGEKLDVPALGVLAGAGIREVMVRRRPWVSILTTGDEIVEPNVHPLPEGKIYSTNSTLLAARLKDLWIPLSEKKAVGDELETMVSVMKRMLEDCEVLITTGGVSVGEKDLLHQALAMLGARPVFQRVKLKPGTPAIFARYEGKYILCLSGNPFAAAATFELLARPLLAAMSGEEHIEMESLMTVLENDFSKKSPGRRFIRGRYQNGRVILPEGHSSGVLSSMIGCNCLVDIPAGSGALEAGDRIRIHLL